MFETNFSGQNKKFGGKQKSLGVTAPECHRGYGPGCREGCSPPTILLSGKNNFNNRKIFFYRKCNGFYKSLSKSAFWAYNIHFLAKHRIYPVFSTIVPMA